MITHPIEDQNLSMATRLSLKTLRAVLSAHLVLPVTIAMPVMNLILFHALGEPIVQVVALHHLMMTLNHSTPMIAAAHLVMRDLTVHMRACSSPLSVVLATIHPWAPKSASFAHLDVDVMSLETKTTGLPHLE
jgi:hypothetical protein